MIRSKIKYPIINTALDYISMPIVSNVGNILTSHHYYIKGDILFYLASGSVSLSNMKLSAVDRAAFLDFSTVGVLTNYVSHKAKITVIDSAGKKLVGYIKEAGTGETYSDELVSGWTNHPTSPYDTLITDGLNITTAQKNTTGLARVVSNAVSIASGDLFRVSLATVRTGGWITVFFQGLAAYTIGYNNFSNYYYTIPNAAESLKLGTMDINTWSMTGFSLRKVLTPSTTGVTITSTPNGYIQSWASQEEGFNYNSVSGYTYRIER